MMKAADTFETSVNFYEITRRNNPAIFIVPAVGAWNLT
jgi:hypothetical protein